MPLRCARWPRPSGPFRGRSCAASDRGASACTAAGRIEPFMPKPPKTVFVCQECGAQSPKWLGRCGDCGAWNSYVEERPDATSAAAASAAQRYGLAAANTAQLYADIAVEQHPRISTGI